MQLAHHRLQAIIAPLKLGVQGEERVYAECVELGHPPFQVRAAIAPVRLQERPLTHAPAGQRAQQVTHGTLLDAGCEKERFVDFMRLCMDCEINI